MKKTCYVIGTIMSDFSLEIMGTRKNCEELWQI